MPLPAILIGAGVIGRGVLMGAGHAFSWLTSGGAGRRFTPGCSGGRATSPSRPLALATPQTGAYRLWFPAGSRVMRRCAPR